MKSEKEIEQIVRKFYITASSKMDKKVCDDVSNIIKKHKHTPVTVNQSPIWRIIMKSPISKIAIAAIVIIGCIIGFTMFNKTSGIALANVLTQIDKIDAYMYETNRNVKSTRIVDGRTINTDEDVWITVLFSQEYGMKMTFYDKNKENINQEMYVIFREKASVQIMPAQKRYARVEINDDQVERNKNQSYNPDKIIRQVLSCKYNSLGLSTIDGKTVEGFQTKDPNYAEGMYSKVDIRLWVDVNTQLPVQVEMDCQAEESEGKINTKISSMTHNFKWNIPVDASEFDPAIPDDYISLTSGSIQMPSNTEYAAIKGLKLYTDLFGNYPKEMNPMAMISQMAKIADSNTPAAKQLQEELKDLNKEERNQKNIETIMPLAGAANFYMQLVQDKKDPAYYGDIVSVGDANNVLMRWKVSDNEYRVIYGDLHAETITSEKLSELEVALPK